jgi:hypothetical protein
MKTSFSARHATHGARSLKVAPGEYVSKRSDRT